MKFAALALDYDGTIAVDGVFDPAVRAAIGEARRRGRGIPFTAGESIVETDAQWAGAVLDVIRALEQAPVRAVRSADSSSRRGSRPTSAIARNTSP